MVFEKIKKAFSGKSGQGEIDSDYLEIDLSQGKKETKVNVRLFALTNYDDVNKVLEALREGFTIAVIDTKVLRQKDTIELKRAISKIKKTTDAIEGSIVGFRENIVIATPAFAKVEKEPEPVVTKTKTQDKLDSLF